MQDEYVYARAAYNAYCETRDWKSVKGEKLPDFDSQSESLKNSWKIAATAVIKQHMIEIGHPLTS